MTTSVERKTVELLDPTAEAEPLDISLAARPRSLEGKTLCLLDNTKTNADALLDEIARLISQRYALKEVVWRRKRNAITPAHFLEEMPGACDLVLTANAD